jgi:hypothetical protein
MKIKTEVYYNLHQKMLSVRVNGKVVAHAPAITLDNPTFHVSEAGRQRVLKSRRKNVHAWVRGDWNNYLHTGTSQIIPENSVEVTYNPYKYSTFVIAKDGTPMKNARYVAIHGRKIYAQI